jgi:predicted permease
MPNLLQELRFSLRTLRKSPGFALTAIVIMAIGIGAVTAIFSVVNSVLLHPLDFPDSGLLVMLRERTAPVDGLDNPAHVRNWEANQQTLAGVALFHIRSVSIATDASHPQMVAGLAVAPDFFSVLGIKPAIGRTFLPGEDTEGHDQVVILSPSAWQKYFHRDPNVIGRIMRDAGRPVTVVGVLAQDLPRFSTMPSGPAANSEAYEIYSPLVIRTDQLTTDGGYDFLALARLRPGVSPRQAQADLSRIQQAFNRANHVDTNPSVIILPLLKDVTSGVTNGLWLLLAAVAAVLLIGCVNLANLQLARAVSRDRELAVRAALGASRDRLLWSSLSESIVLAAVGGALGILLAYAGVSLFMAVAPADLPRLHETHVTLSVLLVAASLSMLTALLFGLLPALRSMHTNPQTALQANSGRVSSSREARSARQTLIAAEVAFTLALLIVAGLLIRSFSHLLTQNRNFDASHVTVASVFLYAPQYGNQPDPMQKVRTGFIERALTSIAQLPGVQSVAITSALPLAGDNRIYTIDRPDRPLPAAEWPAANIRWISPSYATTLRIPLMEGRDFNASDRDHPKNVLLSQQAARSIFPDKDPIGRIIHLNNDTAYTVVGIVADARINDLRSAPSMIYVPFWDNLWMRVYFLVRSAQDSPGMEAVLRKTIWAIDPTVAIPATQTLTDLINNSVAETRFQAALLASFGAAALLLALLGIYGVLSYSVSLRRQEFGIRIALGSDRQRLVALVVRQALTPVVIGASFGLLLAFSATRWLQSLLYQTDSLDPIAVAGSLSLLLLVALLASFVPARRAAGTDAMSVLRNE